MSFFDSVSGILSNVANLAVTAWTGNPMLGQLASSLVDSLLSDSGSSGNSAFDRVFDSAYSDNFLAGLSGRN